MSWAAVAAVGTYVAGEVVSGVGAKKQSGDIGDALKAAQGMYDTTLGQITQKTALDIGSTMSQFRTGRESKMAEGETAITKTLKGAEGLEQKTGMRTGEVEDIKTEGVSDITGAFQKQMQTLTDVKDITIDSTKLAGEVSKSQAEEKYEKMLTELEAMPDTFLEGFMGGLFS